MPGHPGAGRPTKEVVARQRTLRDTVWELAAPQWPAIINRAIKDALTGTGRDAAVAREWLTPWMMGAKPALDITVHHEGELDHSVILWQPGWTPPQLPTTIEHQPPSHPAVPPDPARTLLPAPAPREPTEPHDG